MARNSFIVLILLTLFLWQCESDNEENLSKNPDQAELANVDRFSDEAGTLMRRSQNSELPDSNEPIDFDQSPFLTKGLGPGGQVVKYYNFDVQPKAPVPIYVFFRKGSDQQVDDQLNIINYIPGDKGYNDFWQIYKVMVSDDYVANTVTSYNEIQEKDFEVRKTNTIVNCPVVPKGSTAELRIGSSKTSLTPSWYKGKVAYYFLFQEKPLNSTEEGLVPTSPIYVTFNTNPDPNNPDSGPASGFKTESSSSQTHNVVATLPSDDGYSPLWQVKVYDNKDFDSVTDISSAQSATILNDNAAYVNCPVVYKEE